MRRSSIAASNEFSYSSAGPTTPQGTPLLVGCQTKKRHVEALASRASASPTSKPLTYSSALRSDKHELGRAAPNYRCRLHTSSISRRAEP